MLELLLELISGKTLIHEINQARSNRCIDVVS